MYNRFRSSADCIVDSWSPADFTVDFWAVDSCPKLTLQVYVVVVLYCTVESWSSADCMYNLLLVLS
jgi:hypothetical protein